MDFSRTANRYFTSKEFVYFVAELLVCVGDRRRNDWKMFCTAPTFANSGGRFDPDNLTFGSFGADYDIR